MSLCSRAKVCVMFMLILIVDDFSHLYIPTVSIYVFCQLMTKFKMAATDKQKLGFHYIITNNKHKNTTLMSFFVSNPSERPEYHISVKEI